MCVEDRAGRVLSFSISLLVASFVIVAPRAAAEAASQEEAKEASPCGDGLLDARETCGSCAADCAVKACKPGAKKAAFDVELAVPPARKPAAAGLRLAAGVAFLAPSHR